MRRGPPAAAIILVVLVAGITAVFLGRRASEDERAETDPSRAGAPPPQAGPLAGLAPRLRGLRTGGLGLADAEIVARGLVDRALGESAAPPRALVLGALTHEDWAVNWAGALAVTRYGKPDAELVRALGPLLTDDEPWVRRAAALAAGYAAAAGVEVLDGALAQAAADPEPTVRAAVVRSLARRAARHVERVPLFRQALADADGDVRSAAAYGLAQIELQERLPTDAQEALVAPLRHALTDEASETRMYAAMALGRLGARALPAVPDLLACFGDEHTLVQSQAATALGSLGPAALPALEQALAQEDGRRASLLMWALRLIGEPAVPVLERALEHERGIVRVHAALKLWELRREPTRVLPTLQAALRAKDADVVLQAARAVGRLGPAAASAVPALEALAEHPEEPVRRAAAGALTIVRPGEPPK